MSFTYKLLVAPAAYEELYTHMSKEGEASVKQTIRRLLVMAAQDEGMVDRGIELAVRRARQRSG